MKSDCYNPIYERLIESARELFGYTIDECITFDSLKGKILKNFNNVKIQEVEEKGMSYITYANEEFTFVIKTKDSYYGESYDLSLFLFYYILHLKGADAPKITRDEIESNYDTFYLAHGFLIPEKMYAKACFEIAKEGNNTVTIEELQKKLFDINKRVVYTRSRYLKLYN